MTTTVVVGIDITTKHYTTFFRFNGTHLAWVKVPNAFVAQTADGEFYILPGTKIDVQMVSATKTGERLQPALLAHPLQCLLQDFMNESK